MAVRIIEETVSKLYDYGTVSPGFLVEARFAIDPIEDGLGGLKLRIEPVEPPYVKDYDLDNDESPDLWLKRWDISHWGVISAFVGAMRIGGAIVAWNTPEIHMLEGRKDLAALWDIRVHTDYRRNGIGSGLFSRSVDWARERDCIQLKVETQNVNIPACQFYARQGCRLAAINPFAYPEQPEEVQFIWQLDL